MEKKTLATTAYKIAPISPQLFYVVSPCFNEADSISLFLHDLEKAVEHLNHQFQVVVVNDCSQDHTGDILQHFCFAAPNLSLTVLQLKFNVGHQGAIYQGLLYAHRAKAEQVIVMDCDGEDDPRAIPLLVQQRSHQIVKVSRGKRAEGLSFRIGYFFYRLLFKLVTGKRIDFGNYCLINRNILERIQATSFVHFPAYLLKQKASSTQIIYNRGKRLNGKSKMGSKGLLLHAFRSMIEFAEDLLMLFLRLFIFNMILFAGLMINIFYQKFISHEAILGWFSTLAVSLLILAVISIGFFIIGVLLLNLTYQQNARSYKEIYSLQRKPIIDAVETTA
ncbi:MAG: family 2 glycosyl transferase [Chitinophagaceae bacterium]|nr:family 2 glycosyl transferase [Chitinophagaceae bacterium]